MKLARSAAALAGFAIVVAASLLWPETAQAQCAMCRRALSDSEAAPLIAALRSGILFLLVVPIATFGTIAWFAVRGNKRTISQDEATSPGAATDRANLAK